MILIYNDSDSSPKRLNSYSLFYEGSKGCTFRKLSIKKFKRFRFLKVPFCIGYLIPFLIALDKWGIAQLDPLPCYFSIKKISSIKSLSEIRGRVLPGGKIPEAYLNLKMISSREMSQGSAPGRADDEGLWHRVKTPLLYHLVFTFPWF